jgi:hypothetical protein
MHIRTALLERMPVKEPEEPLERYSDEEADRERDGVSQNAYSLQELASMSMHP